MSALKGKPFVILAALALCAASAVAWSTGVLPGFGSWPLCLGALGAGVVLACGWACCCDRHSQGELLILQRYLHALDQLEPHHLLDSVNGPDLPPLPRGSPWRELAGRVKATFAKSAGRLEDLQQARTALEIRCQRATRQYERIKAILAGVSDPIIAIDHYDELLLANPAAEALFRFDASGAEKRAIAQLVRCQKLVDLLTTSGRRKSTASRSEEIEIADDNGRAQWYRVSAVKLPASGGGETQDASPASGAVAVLRDIGAQKALQKRNAEFVSSVSHEMKTPLAGIKAYVELLVDGDAEDEATREEFLNVISSQADRLQRLVENLLNLARIEAGVVQVNKQSRPLNEILEEAVHVVQPSAEAKEIKLTTDLSPLYLGVLADRDMLLQAAINLLSNAIKYTPQGGQVTLRSRLSDDQALFEVEDTGVGLSEEDCQHVFEKFYRVKKDEKMASGTGLGLPLAKHIVEDVHGGRLTLQSKLGVGSTFTVTLPKVGQMG